MVPIVGPVVYIAAMLGRSGISHDNHGGSDGECSFAELQICPWNDVVAATVRSEDGLGRNVSIRRQQI